MIVLHTWWNLKLQFKTMFYNLFVLYLAPSTSLVEHFSKEDLIINSVFLYYTNYKAGLTILYLFHKNWQTLG